MAKIERVTKGIANAISDDMTEAKFGERKKKDQHDIDNYVCELIERHIPVELRETFIRYQEFIKTTPIVQVRDAAHSKSSVKTIMTGDYFPNYMPIKITEEEYKIIMAMDKARWDYISTAEKYKDDLERFINKLSTPEAIIQAIPESKEIVERYFPTTENLLESLNTLAKKA